MKRSWLAKLFGMRVPRPSAPASRPILARYDAATVTDENRNHWANADSMSARAANAPEVRERLRRHARYEVANNSYARGLVNGVAHWVIGYGAVLQIPLPPTATREQRQAVAMIRRRFAAWAESVNLWQKLWTMRIAKAQDGEAFGVLRTATRPRDPVTLDVQLIEADQVSHGTGGNPMDPSHVDGLELDAQGNVSAYMILPHHPGDALSWADQAAPFSPSAVCHWFRMERPGQVRGIPEITPALPLFAQLRRFRLATLSAAESAAQIVGVIRSTLAPAEDEQTVPFETIEMERGMWMTLPDGRDIGQLKAEHPGTTFDMFCREILLEIGRCLDWPRGLVLGDFSNYNYASGRLELQGTTRSIEVDRYTCETAVLRKVFAAWFAEAQFIPGYLEGLAELEGLDLDPRWMWRSMGHVDREKDEKGRAAALANFTTTLADECGADGADWEEVLQQRAAELARMRELGLTSGGATGADAGTQDAAEPQGDENANEVANA